MNIIVQAFTMIAGSIDYNISLSRFIYMLFCKLIKGTVKAYTLMRVEKNHNVHHTRIYSYQSGYTEHSHMYKQLTIPSSSKNWPCIIVHNTWVFKHSGRVSLSRLYQPPLRWHAVSFMHASGI